MSNSRNFGNIKLCIFAFKMLCCFVFTNFDVSNLTKIIIKVCSNNSFNSLLYYLICFCIVQSIPTAFYTSMFHTPSPAHTHKRFLWSTPLYYITYKLQHPRQLPSKNSFNLWSVQAYRPPLLIFHVIH